MTDLLRFIPSIDALLLRPGLVDASAEHGHDRVAAAAREAADDLRARVRRRDRGIPESEQPAAAWLEVRTLAILKTRLAPSLGPVINATGVVLHTNLGRAPLSAAAIARIGEVAAGYSNLEYDLNAGSRGHRHVHAERLLTTLTGAEAAIVVNNNAAATLVVLAALASGREVIVSRGELVEIGGGFRVPDVMAQSGATLREVGTTNRTRTSDYAAAISDRTALILRVHPSNFRIDGFTERPALADLASLAHGFRIPIFEDLGSGWLGLPDELTARLSDEPSILASLAASVDLVAVSGDKLLGGPQAGLVLGRRDLLDKVRRHPLMRAVRADKLAYAALEATLGLWARPAGRSSIPVYRMLAMSADEIAARTRTLMTRLTSVDGLTCRIIDGRSEVGGGAAPGSAWPTKLLALVVTGRSAADVERRLRSHTPPVVARIENDEVVFDLRTVFPGQEEALAEAIRASAGQKMDETDSAARDSKPPGSTPR